MYVNYYSSDVKQFNLTYSKYIRSNKAYCYWNGYFVLHCVIVSSGFCIQALDNFVTSVLVE